MAVERTRFSIEEAAISPGMAVFLYGGRAAPLPAVAVHPLEAFEWR